MLTVGSLFSGIGGLELGLERAGLGPVLWQVEIDPFCRRVLAKHWPNVKRFDDVTRLRAYPPVELLCGGFPCQDVSSSGKRRGLAGRRSGLWYEYARVVSEVRPRIVVVENVASGKARWLPQVRRDLCALGYRTRAYDLSAFDVGAPHLRRRVFVVGDAHRERRESRRARELATRHREGPHSSPERDGSGGALADTEREQLRQQPGGGRWSDRTGSAIARHACSSGDAPDPNCEPLHVSASTRSEDRDVARAGEGTWWATESGVGGVADGVPHRVDRLRALGNAVVPQCAEVVGRIIVERLARTRAA